MPNNISFLPKDVIAKVAAGEVIEHPGTVIKELVENSLDSGATSITVDVVDCGLTKIRVVDNGCGMTKEDLEKCSNRYATSKIKTLDDLNSLSSFGFRGEALHSIATVSNLLIRTKTYEAPHGYELAIQTGKQLYVNPIGMPDGTEIIVNDLFVNLPARKAYIEQLGPEYKKLLQIIIDLSLGNIDVGFIFKHNNKIALHLPKQQSLKERVKYILDEETTTNMLEISHESENFKMEGLITKPQHAFPNKDNQYLYVNGRSVKQKEVSTKVKEVFGTLLDAKSNPAYILFLTLPKHQVDVNVHPQKTYVQIQNEAEVLATICKTIRKALDENDLVYKVKSPTEFEEFVNTHKRGNDHLAEVLKNNTDLWNIKTNENNQEKEILQIHKLYLVMENPDGITLIDQHAAHERILYETFLEQFIEEKNKLKTIDIDCLVNLPLTLAVEIETNKEHLAKLGILLEHFGANTYKVTQIPEIVHKHDIKTLLIELLSDIKTSSKNTLDSVTKKTLAYLACRTAIKGGDYLTQVERKNLIEKLATTKTNYTCPHGRPVKLEISNLELKKMFKRIPD